MRLFITIFSILAWRWGEALSSARPKRGFSSISSGDGGVQVAPGPRDYWYRVPLPKRLKTKDTVVAPQREIQGVRPAVELPEVVLPDYLAVPPLVSDIFPSVQGDPSQSEPGPTDILLSSADTAVVDGDVASESSSNPPSEDLESTVELQSRPSEDLESTLELQPTHEQEKEQSPEPELAVPNLEADKSEEDYTPSPVKNLLRTAAASSPVFKFDLGDTTRPGFLEPTLGSLKGQRVGESSSESLGASDIGFEFKAQPDITSTGAPSIARKSKFRGRRGKVRKRGDRSGNTSVQKRIKLPETREEELAQSIQDSRQLKPGETGTDTVASAPSWTKTSK